MPHPLQRWKALPGGLAAVGEGIDTYYATPGGHAWRRLRRVLFNMVSS
jgi:hypothetical protein